MTRPDWAKCRDIVGRALELPEGEREAFIRSVCDGDENLEGEVRSLLAADSDDDFLSTAPLTEAATEHDGRVFGSYALEHLIGAGGMGRVYAARHTELGHRVALKVLEPTLLTTETEIERFRREPHRIAALEHPHIVRVHGTGTEGGVYWFAMDFVDGHDLARDIEVARDPMGSAILPSVGDPNRIAAVANLVANMADALHVAHRAGIVHRDVKPSNILIERSSGIARLVDFGIARDERLGDLTRTGAAPGTVYYMSPEQARISKVRVDHRTDVFSLGAVLYELLVLGRPFAGDSGEEVRTKICNQEPTPVRRRAGSVPKDLAAICHRALEKSTSRRYQTAEDMASDLRRFLRFEPVHARLPRFPERVWRAVRRHPRSAIASLAVVLGGMASGGFVHARNRQQQVDAELGVLSELLAISDWETMRQPTQIARLTRARQILANFPEDAAVPEVIEVRSRMDSLEREWFRAGRQKLEGTRSQPQDFDFVDAENILDGLLILQRAAIVFPEASEVTLVTKDALAARLSVRVGASLRVGGTVTLTEFDMALGLPTATRSIGRLPIDDLCLAAGMYRINVQLDSGETREFTRILRYQTEDSIVVEQVLPDAPVSELVPIPGGRLALQDPNRSWTALNNRVVDIAPFEIGRTEVTNAEYRAFLAATGHPQPDHWTRITAEHDSLPVSGVTYFDAQTYAEWVGCRLPSFAEWTFAARGPDNRPVPWGMDPNPLRGNTQQKHQRAVTQERQFDLYFQFVRPVTSDPDARTPDTGLFHMFGNVAEWTDTPSAEPRGGRFIAKPWERIVVGHNWWPGAGRDLTTYQMDEPKRTNSGRGFRICRSREP